MLVPALALVKDYSKRIQQKAQFHGIDVGLQLYKTEYGAFPESKDNGVAPANLIDPSTYCGANKLAEAMIGWDFLGDCIVSGQEPEEERGNRGGWHSPCSGFSFDPSGRVRGWEKYYNLYVPPYRFTSDTEIAFPHQR